MMEIMDNKRTPDIRRILLFLLDLAVVAVVTYAVIKMVESTKGGALVSGGLGALKYYTVLSNIFCAISCLFAALHFIITRGRNLPSWLYVFRLMGSSVVSVTFLVVILFLGLVYGYKLMFTGVSFWLHLIAPVAAIIGQLLLKSERKLRIRASFWGIVPTVFYGVGYISVNAIQWTGTSNPATDFYRFLAWGWGIGCGIFLGVFLINWLVSLLYWAIGRKAENEAKHD